MNARMIAVVAAASLFAGNALAADSNVGTWKTNESKSKIAAGTAKIVTLVYVQDGDKLKATVDGFDGTGKPMHHEWTGKIDGKPYPVVGDPTSDARSLKKNDAFHYEINSYRDGKVTVTGTAVFSEDLKTRTLTSHGKDASGKPFTSVTVFDRT